MIVVEEGDDIYYKCPSFAESQKNEAVSNLQFMTLQHLSGLDSAHDDREEFLGVPHELCYSFALNSTLLQLNTSRPNRSADQHQHFKFKSGP